MYSYYEKIKESKHPILLITKLVKSAKKSGGKPTARLFKTTPKTVKKWLKRYEKAGGKGLEEIQRIPKVSPNKMIPYWIFKIIDVCQKLTEQGKKACPAYLQRDYKIPYSVKAIRKVRYHLTSVSVILLR